MKKYEVRSAKWVDGSGWSYSTTIDWLETPCTAEEYILNNLDSVLDYPRDGTDYYYSITEYNYDPDTEWYGEGAEISGAWASETFDAAAEG